MKNATVSARRKAIPFGVKAQVLAAQTRLEAAETVASILAKRMPAKDKCLRLAFFAYCASCGDPLGNYPATRFDHRPALVARPWDIKLKDFVPAQNDPSAMEAIHHECHMWRTIGRKPGAERTVTTRGSDIGEAARAKRIAAKHEKFKKRRAKKPAKRKEAKRSKWKSRPFPKRPFNRSKRK